jgi:type I restriction enzyme R subunit
MSPTESEWKTRKKRIDPKLDAAGWRLGRGKATPPAFRSEEEETAAGPADYALWLDQRVVGVVEAKKVTVGPQNVLTRARGTQDGDETGCTRYSRRPQRVRVRRTGASMMRGATT